MGWRMAGTVVRGPGTAVDGLLSGVVGSSAAGGMPGTADGASSGGITHGSQLIGGEHTLVGYTAYVDPGLARPLVLSDLTDVTGSTHNITDFIDGSTPGSGVQGDPYIVERLHADRIHLDVPWVTLRGCLFEGNVYGDAAGSHHPGLGLEYCTFDLAAPDGEQCVQWDDFTVNRCLIQGNSDGIRANGGTVQGCTITESIIYVTAQDSGDHNDNIQNSGGDGTVSIQRCLMHMETTNISGLGSSVIQSADMTSGTTWYMEVLDCYIVGKTGTDNNEMLRFYDGGLATSITYKATGNIFDLSPNRDRPYVGRGTSNTTPTGQIVWSNNVDDLGSTLPLL